MSECHYLLRNLHRPALTSLKGIFVFFALSVVCLCLSCQIDQIGPKQKRAGTSDESRDMNTTITGKVTAVMESWPLQLQVATANGPWTVSLMQDTAVTLHGKAVSPGKLLPGQSVQIKGTLTTKEGMIAREVEIID